MRNKPLPLDEKHIVEAITDMVLVVDVDNRVTFANRAFLSFFGLQLKELAGVDPRETSLPIFDSDGRGFKRGEFPTVQAMRTKSAYESLECVVRRPDDSQLRVAVGAAPIENDLGIAGAVLTLHDMTEETHSAAKLRESREQLKAVFEYAPDAFYISDLKGAFIDGNIAAERVTGYRREELIGKSFMSLGLLPREQLPKAAKTLILSISGRPTGPDQFTLIRKDGDHVPIEIRTYPVVIGGKTRVLGIARDISERKAADVKLAQARELLEIRVEARTAELQEQTERYRAALAKIANAEAALKEAEKKFRNLVENSPNVMWTADSRGHTTYISPNVEKVFGYSQNDVYKGGASFFIERMHPDDIERVGRAFQRLLEMKEFSIEYRIKKRDGQWAWVENKAVSIYEEDGVEYAYGLFSDITPRREAEAALARSEQRYRAVAEAAGDAIFLINEDLSLEYVNEVGARLLRMEQNSAVGHDIRNLFPPGMAAGLIVSLKQVFGSGKPLTQEREVPFPNRTVWLETKLTPLLGEDGKVKAVLGISRDTTEKKQAQALSDAVNDKLQEAILVMPAEVPGVEYGSLYRSASEAARVGGDFYDIFELDEDHVCFLVGDISGKGIEAAALTSFVKSTIKAYAFQFDSPGAVISATNNSLYRTKAQFLTVFLGIVDKRSGVLKYCNAGHPPPIIKHADGRTTFFANGELALGVLQDWIFHTSQTSIKGTQIIIYTDGVTEARREGEFFGENRLTDLVASSEARTPAFPNLIFNKIESFSNKSLGDDVAILAIALKDEA